MAYSYVENKGGLKLRNKKKQKKQVSESYVLLTWKTYGPLPQIVVNVLS